MRVAGRREGAAGPGGGVGGLGGEGEGEEVPEAGVAEGVGVDEEVWAGEGVEAGCACLVGWGRCWRRGHLGGWFLKSFGLVGSGRSMVDWWSMVGVMFVSWTPLGNGF